ncbi:hypothetical protein AC579_846 [Pseudocercospora musae]|uniref:Histidine kinase n=1 Tax=Pseudocercospora musae TaxID=113226 RepID=A0A139HUE7_9PEZI|nr:hypothetical protein AC579_846 [Pseudocercospora musae]
MAEDGQGARLLELPPEIRSIAEFLALDERPAAILPNSEIQGDVQHGLSIAYGNPAFDQASDLADLTEALRATVPSEGGQWHGVLLEGKRWQLRVSGEYCTAIAQGQRYKTLAEKEDGAASGHNNESSFGWIGEEPANVSPWIKFIRDFDWAVTPVGPMQSWLPLLKIYVLSMMANPNPRLIVWGKEMTFIYNEACVPLWGAKHPDALGKSVKGIFAEAWDSIGCVIEDAYAGITTRIDEFVLPIQRQGFLEESYWNFTLLPVYDELGTVVGTYDELTESTAAVVSERRRAEINDVSKSLRTARTLPDLWPAVLKSIQSADMPFAMMYAVVDDVPERPEPSESNSSGSSSTVHPKKCVLYGSVGISDDYQDTVDTFPLNEQNNNSDSIVQACLKAWKTKRNVSLSSQDDTLPAALISAVATSKFGTPVRMSIASPINSISGADVLAIMVYGMSPLCSFSPEYELFCNVVIEMIEKNAALISLPEEQQRAQKLADDINSALAQQLRMTTLKAEKSEAKFARLAGAAPTGMFMFDVTGRALYVNDTYLEMLGITREEHAQKPDGHPWHEQIHEDDLERFYAIWQRVVIDKVPITVEYRMKKPWQSTDKMSGQDISGETWLLATAFPEIEADGTVSTIQGWLTDISYRKFSQNVVSQRLEDALENKRQTENFIDMTSHEMRNPLSAILQSADSIVSTMGSNGLPNLDESMTLDVNVAQEIVDAAQTIILCAQHQKRIVDDILTLSKLDASLLVISPDKVQTPTLLIKALKMYEAELERAEIDAQICIEPSYSELEVDWVVLDPSRLLQVIINLLTNSIKFTQYAETRKIKICLGASYQRPTGKHHGITFIPARHSRPARTPRSELESGEDIYLQMAVYDTGKGLNDDEMKVLFQRFQQASPKTYKQYGGSGLGLFISRELCELQGGQIGVASTEGKTVFTFYVRAKRWTEQTAGKSQRPGPVRFTSASASPVVYSRRGSMPLEQSHNPQTSTTRRQSGSIVEDFHPLSRKVSKRQSAAASAAAPAINSDNNERNDSAQKDQLHVLIVEDNTINQKVMSQQLRRAGCIVHVANHGLECLEFLDKTHFCSADTPLSIILLDLEMPTMDGLTCIRHIRERQKNGKIVSHVPVIAVTANARSEQISTAIEAGMDQVVTKPFRIPELVPQMHSLVAEFGAVKVNSG